jgi:hypothetical protein
VGVELETVRVQAVQLAVVAGAALLERLRVLRERLVGLPRAVRRRTAGSKDHAQRERRAGDALTSSDLLHGDLSSSTHLLWGYDTDPAIGARPLGDGVAPAQPALTGPAPSGPGTTLDNL